MKLPRRTIVVLHLLLKVAAILSLVVVPAAMSTPSDSPVASKRTPEQAVVETSPSEQLKTQVQRPTMPKTASNSSRRLGPKTIPRKRQQNNETKSSTTSQRKLPSSPAASQPDPVALAQQQAQLIRSYNNTPPLFLTPTRDFYVDVASQPLGTTIRTMSAVDLEGDHLEYSLKPANVHDASPYFSINPTTGELKLANKQLVFQTTQRRANSSQPASPDNDTNEGDGEESAEDDDGDTSVNHDQSVADHEAENQNLYFLNVAADDGKYSSIVELQIHVLNSSIPHSDGSAAVGKQTADKLVQRKSAEFYNKLYRLTPTSRNTSAPSARVVYPNFVNPSIVMPQQQSVDNIGEAGTAPDSSIVRAEEPFVGTVEPPIVSNLAADRLTKTAAELKINSLDQTTSLPVSVGSPPSEMSLQTVVGSRSLGAVGEPFMSQPMLLALVVISAALMIALVLLMFVVPLSVKRLRKRLKHVEMQHEQISQKASSNSSTICSSSSGSLASHPHHLNHHLNQQHNPSLSQFTLGSASSACPTSNPSSVCRQSSLDSTISQQTTQASGNLHFQHQRSQFICPPITNPVYLQQQQHPSNFHQGQIQIQNQAFLLPNNECHMSSSLIERQQPEGINIYYPVDDDFYSTIETDSTALDLDALDKTRAKQQDYGQKFITQCQANADEQSRQIESPVSDSGSSTRSLVRFLSLPARHAAHALANKQQQEACVSGNIQQREFPEPDSNNNVEDPFIGLPVIPVAKTIARSSQVEREQNRQTGSSNSWELDRHKLRFLDILDEGQFGMVWRCQLKQQDVGDRIVAVKTLKNSSARDERGCEELLAEIEIMKLVCQHPNVVKILHCCTSDSTPRVGADTKPILLVMEYEKLGKLQSFLEKSRINHSYATNLYTNNNDHSIDHLTSRDLVKFIYHVAKGMEYISSRCIVHRDLASRNILVSSHRICKIGDFGMARHMQSLSGIYERHSRNAKVPVRWMAPEVLLENKFTIKSDVFSFGILMWEIVTLGSTPYRHLKTEQVVERVARQGERPDRPEYCHEQLYKIMSRCWNHNPDTRPTFNQLSKELAEMLLSADDYIELDQYPDHNYCNIPGSAAPHELL